jgi:hypothetical protein
LVTLQYITAAGSGDVERMLDDEDDDDDGEDDDDDEDGDDDDEDEDEDAVGLGDDLEDVTSADDESSDPCPGVTGSAGNG